MNFCKAGLLLLLALLMACGEPPIKLQAESALAPDGASQTPAGFEHFIRRQGHQLFEGHKPFRFIGLHATELHRIEDDVRSASSTLGKSDHFKWPSAREQENWIKSLVYSGHTATRVYTLSIDDMSLPATVRAKMPAHVLWHDGGLQLNEEAMVAIDRMIYLADRYGLRLIIPFIDHWSWWGGKRELALMAGEGGADNKETGPLYDVGSRTFALYCQLIEKVVSRRNTLTGRHYYEEPAIMAWETGNELRGTNKAFLAKTAALIKQLAPNQLVVDGDQQADNTNAATQDQVSETEFLGLLDANVDIQSNHFYGDYMQPEVLIRQASLVQQYGKVFLLGEYGLQEVDKITAMTEAALAHPAVGGALIWGYRGHREAGGFYWHMEGNSGHLSYHLPGFPVNASNQEQAVVGLLRKGQAQLANNPQARNYASRWTLPEAPLLYAIGPNGEINWMGSPMALSYRLYRKAGEQPWTLLADKLVDAANGWDPETMNLYVDQTARPGMRYRLTAVNPAGESEPSNEVQ